MTLAFDTGATRETPCGVCGKPTTEREAQLCPGPVAWFRERHDAHCGRPCRGAGVRPKPRTERAPGEGGLDHCHAADRCGAPGCKGGAP